MKQNNLIRMQPQSSEFLKNISKNQTIQPIYIDPRYVDFERLPKVYYDNVIEYD